MKINNSDVLTVEDLTRLLKENSAEDVLAQFSDEKTRITKAQNETIARYVALKSLVNACEEELENLKFDVEDIMHEGWNKDGCDRRTARVDGLDIGSVTLCKSKKKYRVTNWQAFNEWLQTNGLDDTAIGLDEFYAKDLLKLLKDNFAPSVYEKWFFVHTKPSRDFERAVEVVDAQTCAVNGLAVAGIEPAPTKPTHVMCKPKPAREVWRVLQMKSKDEIGNLLLGEVDASDIDDIDD